MSSWVTIRAMNPTGCALMRVNISAKVIIWFFCLGVNIYGTHRRVEKMAQEANAGAITDPQMGSNAPHRDSATSYDQEQKEKEREIESVPSVTAVDESPLRGSS